MFHPAGSQVVPPPLHPAARPIQLTLMPQLAEAKEWDDDWTGMADAASRRKRQVRLSMRAYRRRKGLESIHKLSRNKLLECADSVPCWNEDRQAIVHLPVSLAQKLNSGKGVLQFTENSLPSRLTFPIGLDHLITLVQVNFLRASQLNNRLLSDAGCSTSYDCSNGVLHTLRPVQQPWKVLPPTLAPTELQAIVPHDSWIDIFPHPGWRNNFLGALGSVDEKELCSDLVGGLFGSRAGAEGEMCGIVIWSPPWHFDGWELSEGFVRKWGWCIKGCEEILRATNKWRALRGEEPLAIKS